MAGSRTVARQRVLAATLAVAVTLVGVAGVTAAFTTAPVGGGAVLRYVALGDSYTSGPFIPEQVADPPRCRRSARNYPRLVAARLGASLRDVSCTGASTVHMTGPQSLRGGERNRPQLADVTPDTDLVSIGIGGNDAGFGAVVHNCLAAAPSARPCQQLYSGAAGDEISRRIAEVAGRVDAVLAEVRRRAPTARVYLVGYPAILPDSGTGCWSVLPIVAADVPYLRDKTRELNAMLADRAAAGGATFVDTYGPSVGHDACAAPGARWVEPLAPVAPAAPIHPNQAGMRATARAVLRAVAAPGQQGRPAPAGRVRHVASRVAEHVVRRRLFGRPQRLRVDLHGVSVFGPGHHHEVIRWEWVERITVDSGVVVAGGGHEIVLPPGAFGLEPEVLAEHLRAAGSLDHRTDVIGILGATSRPY